MHVEKCVEEHPEQGYKSVSEFVHNAIRHRVDRLGIFMDVKTLLNPTTLNR